MLVAGELDLAHLYRGAFLDVEVDLDGSRRNGLDVGLDGGELVAVLGEQFFEDRLGALDLGGIVLALDGKADLFLLEAVEHVRVRDGIEAFVVDLADGGFFLDEDVEDDAFFRVFALDAQVFEVAGVPKGVEVALDGDGIVDIAVMGEEAREEVSLGMRRLPMTRIEAMVLACWARETPAARRRRRKSATERTASGVKRARQLENRKERGLDACLIFTGLEPCGGHKYWCGP